MTRRRSATVAATLAVCLGAGWLSYGSALDRAGAVNPSLARFAPADQRGRAWKSLADDATLAGRTAVALEMARRAVLADPVDAASAASLATARLAGGDLAGAEQAFRVAGELGWRNRPTQLYWAVSSARRGSEDVAALRADALFRQDNGLLGRAEILDGMHATAAGRAALAKRIAIRPSWYPAYLNALSGLKPAELEARALVLADPTLNPAVIGCGEVQPLVAALAGAGSDFPAAALSRRFCGPSSKGLRDGDFSQSSLGNPGPLGWQFSGAGGIDVRLVPDGPRKSQKLSVASLVPAPTQFAAQTLQLEQGRYSVSVIARENGGRSARIEPRAICVAGTQITSTATAPARIEVEVPSGCPLQRIELWVAPGDGVISVDRVEVERLG